MGHRDSYAATALCQDEESGDETALRSEVGGSDTSFETWPEEKDSVEEDSAIVDIDSEVVIDEALLLADDAPLVVPEKEESVGVIVVETQRLLWIYSHTRWSILLPTVPSLSMEAFILQLYLRVTLILRTHNFLLQFSTFFHCG
jgi:hypothetical protein